MDDELLDLVNGNDEVIGTINRNEHARMMAEKLGYIRAIDMFIMNDEGRLWIPTRTAHKTIAPNGLDYSVGGHVSAGETYLESLLREAEEEINTELLPENLVTAIKIGPDEIGYIRQVYLYHSNDTPAYNPNDFVGAQWLSPQEVIQRIDAGKPAKRSIKPTILSLIEQGYLS